MLGKTLLIAALYRFGCRRHVRTVSCLPTTVVWPKLKATSAPRHCLLFHHFEVSQTDSVGLISQQYKSIDGVSVADLFESPPLQVCYRFHGNSQAFQVLLKTQALSGLNEIDVIGETILFKAIRCGDLPLGKRPLLVLNANFAEIVCHSAATPQLWRLYGAKKYTWIHTYSSSVWHWRYSHHSLPLGLWGRPFGRQLLESGFSRSLLHGWLQSP